MYIIGKIEGVNVLANVETATDANVMSACLKALQAPRPDYYELLTEAAGRLEGFGGRDAELAAEIRAALAATLPQGSDAG